MTTLNQVTIVLFNAGCYPSLRPQMNLTIDSSNKYTCLLSYTTFNIEASNNEEHSRHVSKKKITPTYQKEHSRQGLKNNFPKSCTYVHIHSNIALINLVRSIKLPKAHSMLPPSHQPTIKSPTLWQHQASVTYTKAPVPLPMPLLMPMRLSDRCHN